MSNLAQFSEKIDAKSQFGAINPPFRSHCALFRAVAVRALGAYAPAPPSLGAAATILWLFLQKLGLIFSVMTRTNVLILCYNKCMARVAPSLLRRTPFTEYTGELRHEFFRGVSELLGALISFTKGAFDAVFRRFHCYHHVQAYCFQYAFFLGLQRPMVKCCSRAEKVKDKTSGAPPFSSRLATVTASRAANVGTAVLDCLSPPAGGSVRALPPPRRCNLQGVSRS